MLVNDRVDRLTRTLSELQLATPTTPVVPENPPPPPPRSASLPPRSKSLTDPSFSLFETFARVTQVAREISTTLLDPKFPQRISEERKKLLTDYESYRRSRSTSSSRNVLDQTQETTTPVGVFEVLSVTLFLALSRSPSPLLIFFFLLQSDKTSPIEETLRIPALSVDKWLGYFDGEGRIRDPDSLKKAIFLGVRPSLPPLPAALISLTPPLFVFRVFLRKSGWKSGSFCSDFIHSTQQRPRGSLSGRRDSASPHSSPLLAIFIFFLAFVFFLGPNMRLSRSSGRASRLFRSSTFPNSGRGSTALKRTWCAPTASILTTSTKTGTTLSC